MGIGPRVIVPAHPLRLPGVRSSGSPQWARSTTECRAATPTPASIS